jgi:hypothetical protein
MATCKILTQQKAKINLDSLYFGQSEDYNIKLKENLFEYKARRWTDKRIEGLEKVKYLEK